MKMRRFIFFKFSNRLSFCVLMIRAFLLPNIRVPCTQNEIWKNEKLILLSLEPSQEE